MNIVISQRVCILILQVWLCPIVWINFLVNIAVIQWVYWMCICVCILILNFWLYPQIWINFQTSIVINQQR